MLTDTSRGAIETRDGEVAWEFPEANAEVTPDGQVVWELAGGGYGRARR